MTPSEIADWLDCTFVVSKHHAQAAATIRELEASNKTKADIIYAQAKAADIDRAKLEIAMEALDEIADVYVSKIATQALARIKEIG